MDTLTGAPANERARLEEEASEARMAGVLVAVAQKALAEAEQIANRGALSPARPATRGAIAAAKTAADDAQRAINAELEATR